MVNRKCKRRVRVFEWFNMEWCSWYMPSQIFLCWQLFKLILYFCLLIHLSTGIALTHLEDPTNAKQAYDQAISIEPDNPITYDSIHFTCLISSINRLNQEILVSDWLITSDLTYITSSDWSGRSLIHLYTQLVSSDGDINLTDPTLISLTFPS